MSLGPLAINAGQRKCLISNQKLFVCLKGSGRQRAGRRHGALDR